MVVCILQCLFEYGAIVFQYCLLISILNVTQLKKKCYSIKQRHAIMWLLLLLINCFIYIYIYDVARVIFVHLKLRHNYYNKESNLVSIKVTLPLNMCIMVDELLMKLH